MAIKMNLSLLIFCIIVSQGMASLSDNINTDALDLLVRKKRIIDRSLDRNKRPKLQDLGYVVQIRQYGENICSGSILSAHVILTTARCASVGTFVVVAGTVSTETGKGTIHFVNGKLRHPNYAILSLENNIALLSVLEPIVLGHGYNRAIQIYQSHDGLLPPNTMVTTSGWGSVLASDRGLGCMRVGNETIIPKSIRSMSVPTISLQECRKLYHNANWISNQLICTHHPEKHCSEGDEGNPLVFGEHLVGVLTQSALADGPDTYMNVALPLYRNWIIRNMNRIPPIEQTPRDVEMQMVGRHKSSLKVHPSNH